MNRNVKIMYLDCLKYAYKLALIGKDPKRVVIYSMSGAEAFRSNILYVSRRE